MFRLALIMHQSFVPLANPDPQKIVGIYHWPIFETLLISLPLFSSWTNNYLPLRK